MESSCSLISWSDINDKFDILIREEACADLIERWTLKGEDSRLKCDRLQTH